MIPYLSRKISISLVVLVMAAWACGARAQTDAYPSKPIRLIVPYPPGAGTDAVSRLVATQLSRRLGQPILVENRAGANGNVGTEFVAKAPADGYTLLVATPGPISVGRSLYKTLRYDPAKDFTAVSLLAVAPVLALVNPKVPANSLQELVNLARKNPNKYDAAIAASGSVNHLVTAMFIDEAKAPLLSVPYKGGAQAVTDILGGHVSVIFISVASVVPYIKGGLLRPLAVAATSRSPLIPQVPTTAEAGYPDIVGSQWNGIVAPAGTPAHIVARLHTNIQAVLAQPDIQRQIELLGMTAGSTTPQEFQAFLQNETTRWAAVIAKAGITAE